MRTHRITPKEEKRHTILEMQRVPGCADENWGQSEKGFERAPSSMRGGHPNSYYYVYVGGSGRVATALGVLS
jgi:hypothetical protein